jgi:hypothetical protein
MYWYYQRAEVCYVFVLDLPRSASVQDALQNCRWVKRGWTLQELIAPENLVFFDQEWNIRGTKEELVDDLSRITGINPSVLLHKRSLSSVAVAQKMSWAAKRETTRVEDTAYCLLGIFNVNMPLLYGEEEKAFRRLQEEIVKSTPDFSLFAWTMPTTNSNRERVWGQNFFSGLLAKAPLDFAVCTSFERDTNRELQEFSISNIGIKTKVKLLCEPIQGMTGLRFILPLDGYWRKGKILGARVRKCGHSQFIREDPGELVEIKANCLYGVATEKYFLMELPEIRLPPGCPLSDKGLFIAQTRSHVLQIRSEHGVTMYDIWPRSRYDDQDELLFTSGSYPDRIDCGLLKFGIDYAVPVGRQKKQGTLECMFCAVGWSNTIRNRLQCKVVDYQSFAPALDELLSQANTRDFSSPDVLGHLVRQKIPKTSSARFTIPCTNATGLVSFTSTMVTDPTICQNSFWRIDFRCDIYQDSVIPAPHSEKWNV